MQYVIQQELGNGAICYSQRDPSGSTYLGGYGVNVGSVYDPRGDPVTGKPSRRGLAHAVEHIAARESKKYSVLDVDRVIHSVLGGLSACNIAVNLTGTSFATTMLASKKHLTVALNMFRSLLKDRIITSFGKSVELAAIHQEHWLTGSSYDDLIASFFYETAYDINPARNPVDGYVDEFKQITLADVRAFIRRYYVPRNMFFLTIGPKADEAKEMGERYLGDWPKGSMPTIDYNHSDDFIKLTTMRSNEKPTEGVRQHLIAIGFRTETYLSPDGPALDMLAEILRFRLLVRLREANTDFNKGAYRTPVVTDRSFIHGLIYTWMATLSAEYAKYCEDIIIEEFNRVREELVSKEDFEAFRQTAIFPYLLAFRGYPDNLSDLIMDAAGNGDRDMSHLNSFKQRFAKVTRRKLRDVANKYFTQDYIRAIIRPA